MCSSLLQIVYKFLLLIQVLLIIIGGQCAPKLGGIHFEQLLLETFMDEDNNTNANYKREFTVRFPAYHTNIKNTTSLYAKLTGYSINNSELSGSNHKSKKNKELDNTAYIAYAVSKNSDFNYTADITKSVPTTISTSNLWSTSPLITVKINTSNHSPNPENTDNSNTVIEELIANKDLHKSKPKDNKRHESPIKPKSRRDGVTLQSDGYAFNQDNCQMRGDRVLCGYNNQELIGTETDPVDKDCILRGDRIECGYINRRAGNNRRNNTEKRGLQTGSEITNVTSNRTTDATDATETTQRVSLFDTTEISTPASNITNQPTLSKFDTQELSDRVENSFASIITNGNTTFSPTATTVFNVSKTITNTSSTITHDEQPKLSKLMELIGRVEKILASADTTTNPSNFVTASNKRTRTENASEVYNLRESETHDNPVSSAHTAVLTNFNINSTISTTTSSTSTTTTTASSRTTTTSSTTSTTTTPVPYIDDGEYCIEKDGRIVCYDNLQEEYDDDDYMEK